ncbi:hypothetical Protein YC6258_01366 [Gynuella sunshinyii YC6258]|uniref:Uncharacterized protein n=1 Tax=Gynuella sunshinyii YC6258 TaxID=1445510 RepID=A0A0C5VSW2_9GAMM|nr:hypothetical Protein YC6258_01366 [Gynuella sunshinyii YC6258]
MILNSRYRYLVNQQKSVKSLQQISGQYCRRESVPGKTYEKQEFISHN